MMRTGRIAAGVATLALLATVNLGCAAKQTTQRSEVRDTWTAAAKQSDAAATRAEVAAKRAEAASSRAEASAKRIEDAASRMEAMMTKSMRK